MFLHNEDCFTADGRDANPLRVLDGLLRGYDRRSTPHRHQGAGAATLVWTELYIASLGSINTDNMVSMLLQVTIIRNYFVKTQTYVAFFSPPDLSIIFSTGMYLEVSPL